MVESRWAMMMVVRPTVEPLQRLLDQQLGLSIHRRGRLVQDEHGSVLEHGAGDGEALLLPTGELDAPLTDEGIVAVRQRLDELVGVGHPGRLDHLLLGGVRPAEEDVLAHGAVEEEDVLQHDAHLLAQAGEVDVAQVAPVEGDAPLADVVEARDQAGQGRLAHAGRTHQGHDAAGRHVEVDVLEHGVFLVIVEADVVEAQRSGGLAAQGGRAGAFGHLGLARPATR